MLGDGHCRRYCPQYSGVHCSSGLEDRLGRHLESRVTEITKASFYLFHQTNTNIKLRKDAIRQQTIKLHGANEKINVGITPSDG